MVSIKVIIIKNAALYINIYYYNFILPISVISSADVGVNFITTNKA